MKISFGVADKTFEIFQRRLAVIAAAFLLIFIAAGRLYADDTGVLKNDDLMVRFDSPLSGAAKRVTDIYPAVRAELHRATGWETDFKPLVVLVRDRGKFRQMSGSDLTVAFAVPRDNVIVVDYSRMGVAPFTFATTLKHELCHLLLHDHIRSGLPRWLDEGYCQWVNGGLSEIMLDEKWPPVKEAALSGRFLSMDSLSDGFPPDNKSLLLAYDESRNLVEYIVSEYGTGKLNGILNGLSRGEDAGTAVEKNLSVSLGKLEQDWQRRLRKGATWPAYLGSYIYELLFAAAALVTLAGFIRMLLRKRAYKDEDDEEEGGFGPE